MKKFITIIAALFITMFAAAAPYTISQDGIEFIKKHEKCVLTAYPDAGGWSIGYGHHNRGVHEGMTITKAQADKYLEEDIKMFTGSVNRLLNALPYEYEFSQGFIDGFFSLVYNCGEGGVKRSVFYQRLLRCRVKDGVMDQSDFNFAVAGVKSSNVTHQTHVNRRYQEHLMMLS